MPPPSLSGAPSQLSIQDQSAGRSRVRIISCHLDLTSTKAQQTDICKAIMLRLTLLGLLQMKYEAGACVQLISQGDCCLQEHSDLKQFSLVDDKSWITKQVLSFYVCRLYTFLISCW